MDSRLEAHKMRFAKLPPIHYEKRPLTTQIPEMNRLVQSLVRRQITGLVHDTLPMIEHPGAAAAPPQ